VRAGSGDPWSLRRTTLARRGCARSREPCTASSAPARPFPPSLRAPRPQSPSRRSSLPEVERRGEERRGERVWCSLRGSGAVAAGEERSGSERCPRVVPPRPQSTATTVLSALCGHGPATQGAMIFVGAFVAARRANTWLAWPQRGPTTVLFACGGRTRGDARLRAATSGPTTFVLASVAAGAPARPRT
jgi:hypothetical protein